MSKNMPHTYAPGDLVKIISMEEVRKYPVINGWLDIGGPAWVPDMDKFAGTIQEIKEVLSIYGYYKLTNDPGAYFFSPEMIEGPAEATQVPDREKYAERLERFVLAVIANRDSMSSAWAIVESAKNLLAAFDEEVKKYKV